MPPPPRTCRHQQIGAIEVRRLIVKLIGVPPSIRLPDGFQHQTVPSFHHKLVEGHKVEHQGVDLAHGKGMVLLIHRHAQKASCRCNGMREAALLEVLKRDDSSVGYLHLIEDKEHVLDVEGEIEYLAEVRDNVPRLEATLERLGEPWVLLEVERGIVLVVLPRELLEEVTFAYLARTEEQ